ncbi:MAG TPA: O-antigen ligase family protein [Bryobacteraceae bacterium]|nr:O-antigen ligase family protein [Bryobacteraceae bacterium]
MSAVAFSLQSGAARRESAVGAAAGIEKAALFLVFAGISFHWISAYLLASVHIEMPEWVETRYYLYICIPALLLSVRSYGRFAGFTKTPSMLACLTLMLGGLLWTAESEVGRGALKFAGFAVTIPLASLIVKNDYTRRCSQWFVWGTVASLALAVAIEGDGLAGYRFGTLIDVNGRTASNPNSVGAQAALAACLLTLQFWRTTANRRSRLTNAASAAAILFLVYAVFLTASRTAFIVLAGTLLWSLVLRCQRSPTALLWGGMALLFSVSMLWAADSLLADANNDVYSQIRSRLFQDQEGTVGTLGSRTLIWQFAGGLLTEDTRWVAGFGTGGVDKALGTFFELGEYAIGRDGIRRLHSHSTFIDWALMFGLVGLLVPAWLAIRAARTALRLDLEDDRVDRTSLLMFALLFSFGGVITTEVFWIAFGSLLWASLSRTRTAPEPCRLGTQRL